VERYYERNVEAEFTTPKRVRASQILKRVAPNAPEAEVAAKRKELAAAYLAAKKGENFAALVKQVSDDKASKDGDLGLFRREEMPPEVADAAFALKPGEVSNIVRSPFGLHIIRVTEVQPEVKQPLDKVRKQIEDKLRGERAEHKLNLEVDRLPGRIQKDGLEAVAKEFQSPLVLTEWIDGTQPLRGLGPSAEFYGRLKGRHVDDVGVWKRNPVQGHAFFQIAETKDAYTRPLADVRPLVELKVAETQRREAALAEAKAAFPKLKGPGDLAAYAKGEGLKVQSASVTATNPNIPGLGSNREFQQTAFRLTAAQPYALSIRNNQVHLLHLKRRYFPKPEQEAETKAKIAQQLEQDWRQYFLNAALQQLRERTGVKILVPDLLAPPPAAPPAPASS
jgi:peptidyl-prolyl cis-trans isomerase D